MYIHCIFLEKKSKLFANSGDPDLGLHCLPITFSRYPEYNGLNMGSMITKDQRI